MMHGMHKQGGRFVCTVHDAAMSRHGITPLKSQAEDSVAPHASGCWDEASVQLHGYYRCMACTSRASYAGTECFSCCWDGAGAQPLVKLGWGVVDVRDAAKAHVAAIENLNAKGR